MWSGIARNVPNILNSLCQQVVVLLDSRQTVLLSITRFCSALELFSKKCCMNTLLSVVIIARYSVQFSIFICQLNIVCK